MTCGGVAGASAPAKRPLSGAAESSQGPPYGGLAVKGGSPSGSTMDRALDAPSPAQLASPILLMHGAIQGGWVWKCVPLSWMLSLGIYGF